MTTSGNSDLGPHEPTDGAWCFVCARPDVACVCATVPRAPAGDASVRSLGDLGSEDRVATQEELAELHAGGWRYVERRDRWRCPVTPKLHTLDDALRMARKDAGGAP